MKRGSEEKDLVNGMFEVVLSTLENKLRRVENLDRAVQHLVRKMDNLEKQVEDHAVTLLERVDEHEGKQPRGLWPARCSRRTSTLGRGITTLRN